MTHRHIAHSGSIILTLLFCLLSGVSAIAAASGAPPLPSKELTAGTAPKGRN